MTVVQEDRHMVVSACKPLPELAVGELDVVDLHSQLAASTSVLDVMQAGAQAAFAQRWDTLWVTIHFEPDLGVQAFCRCPVRDAELRCSIQRLCVDEAACLDGPRRIVEASCISRWQDAGAAVVEAVGGGWCVQPLRSSEKLLGVIAAASVDEGDCARDIADLRRLLCLAAPHVCLQLRDLMERARVDPETGLWNESELRRRLDIEVERARSCPIEFSLVVMELSMGPGRRPNILAESELKALGKTLQTTLRGSDWASRLGDGRIALLLPMTNERNALIAVSRVMDNLRKHPDLPADLHGQTGISGWTFEGTAGPELFDQARSALNSAKVAGVSGAFVYL